MPSLSLFCRSLAVAASLFAGTCYAQVMPTPAPGQKDPGTSNSEAVTSGSQASLGQDEVNKILKQAEDASNRTFSMEGLRTTPQTKRTCKEMICVVDRNGKILGHKEMPDGWIGSIDIALGKARTAVFFSSDENALSSRQVGQLAQAHGPDGNGQAGPLWGIWATNQDGGKRADQVERNCIVTFPGGLPLYKQGHLVGAIGVSGDGVDQDESIAFGGAQGYMPAPSVGSPTPLVPKPVDWKTPGQ